MKKESGIYSITNKINGKSYIGSANNMNARWQHHKSHLRRNTHDNPHLQHAWNKYGEDSFECKCMESCTKEELHFIEQSYLDICKALPTFYYNISYNVVHPGMFGRKHSDETRRKISSKLQLAFANGHSDKLKKAWKNTKSIQRNVDNNVYSFRNNVTGETFTGRQVEFYKKYSLFNSKVCLLINGKRKTHKDWVLS